MTATAHPASASASTSAPGALFAQLMDHGVRADPYPLYARMREQPVLECGDGMYVVARHADVGALLRDRRICSDMRKSAAGDPIRRDVEPSFLLLDPPDHTRIRALVVREFRPRVVERLRARMVAVVDELVDAMAGRDEIELVADFAYPLPVTMICELLGVPRADEPRFQHWSAMIIRSLDGSGLSEAGREQVAGALGDMQAYMAELVAARRARPGEDYLSLLVRAEEEGHRLSAEEVVVTLSLLLVAGHETTVNLIVNAVLALLRDPAGWRRVCEDPALVPAAVEETLRHDPPVQFRNRTCIQDIRLHDTTIPARSTIVLMLAAAGRDPERYPDPARFDLDRAVSGQLGFGAGPHFCVGAGLARMEAQLALAALTQRLRSPRLLEDRPPYRRNAALRGPERLRIGVDAVEALTAS